jgi:hypothetical protein
LADHKLAKAEAENKRLRAALEWYSDDGNYTDCNLGVGPGEPVLQDEGQRARKALEADSG